MKYISNSICSLLLLASAAVFGQEEQPAADTVAVAIAPSKIDRYGIRIGADISRPARAIYDKDFKGIELVADYRLTKKIYAAGEVGTVDFRIPDDLLDFTTKGSYIKLGFDYNAYENWLDMENMIYTGVRYGFSSFSQNLNAYTIYDTNPYFDDVVVRPDKKFSGLSAHWVEIIGGLKAEIFDNLFMGFSVRLNILLTEKEPDNFANLYIPGFNRTYDGNFGVGFNYTLSYFIPLYKKSNDKPREEVKK
ncbi:hypothetical protein AMR72_02115 [Flavobacterium psychrophilum]|nr:hypothetical protein AMR72_02115 [Flavobacterium psychrophilum]AOE51422.1 hypothetical protein ALW18_02115 [Flavobacterium psychrophilum]